MDKGATVYLRFIQGDERAFDELVSLYRNTLVLFISSYLHDLAESEDVAEEVFIDLYLKRRRYTAEATFKTYLFKIARNKALNELRRRKTRILPIDGVPLATDDAFSSVAQTEESRKLFSALEEMDVNLREVLVLRYVEDMSVAEVAKVLKISPKRVSNLVYRAKAQLKRIAKEVNLDEN